MAEKGLPVLLMRAGTKGARVTQVGRYPRQQFKKASRARQAERFAMKFQKLVSPETSALGLAVPAADSHMVLVFETRGHEQEFLRAVNNTKQARIKLREDSALLKEWSEHQWASTLSATGKLIEDPTTENHCSDGALYAHRHTYHLRFLPEIAKPTVGTAAWASQAEAEMEEATHERLDNKNIFGW